MGEEERGRDKLEPFPLRDLGSFEKRLFEVSESGEGAKRRGRDSPETAQRGSVLRGSSEPVRDGGAATAIHRVTLKGEVEREVIGEGRGARRSRDGKVSVMVRDGDVGGNEGVVGKREGKKEPSFKGVPGVREGDRGEKRGRRGRVRGGLDKIQVTTDKGVEAGVRRGDGIDKGSTY